MDDIGIIAAAIAAAIALPVGLVLFSAAVYWFSGAAIGGPVRDEHPAFLPPDLAGRGPRR